MVVLIEELWWLSFVCDGHHASIALKVETTFLTKDCLVRTSVVPVGGRLREAMAAGIVAVRERDRGRGVKEEGKFANKI